MIEGSCRVIHNLLVDLHLSSITTCLSLALNTYSLCLLLLSVLVNELLSRNVSFAKSLHRGVSPLYKFVWRCSLRGLYRFFIWSVLKVSHKFLGHGNPWIANRLCTVVKRRQVLCLWSTNPNHHHCSREMVSRLSSADIHARRPIKVGLMIVSLSWDLLLSSHNNRCVDGLNLWFWWLDIILSSLLVVERPHRLHLRRIFLFELFTRLDRLALR